MERIINKVLRYFLSENKIWEIKNKHNVPSMEWSLMNIKKLGFEPRMVIDVGAFNGEWTEMFKNIFPSSKVLMIEGQASKKDDLSRVSAKFPGTKFQIALLGSEKNKEVTFHVNATVSSVLEEYKSNSFKTETRRLELLDDIFKEQNEPELPNFIKLDVQGYELEILKGSSKILESVEFILCEVSLIEINKNCPLLGDVVKFMDDIGFVCYDICSFIRRPLDRALWQTDILFIKKGHILGQNKHWN
jgi:FkbM family methyltransferase